MPANRTSVDIKNAQAFSERSKQTADHPSVLNATKATAFDPWRELEQAAGGTRSLEEQ